MVSREVPMPAKAMARPAVTVKAAASSGLPLADGAVTGLVVVPSGSAVVIGFSGGPTSQQKPPFSRHRSQKSRVGT
jgi:hypothetical protein